ncbi:hypothetical protein KDA11_06165, partial [Candidatus Saccharibacteria bacterium]|nr:hypothetical protein [Candidatus Saccharibacteria bacterium]
IIKDLQVVYCYYMYSVSKYISNLKINNMPAKNPDTNLPQSPNDQWRQLASEAIEQWDLEHPGVAALYENHVVPRLLDDNVNQSMITSEERSGGRFLHKHGNIDPEEVEHVVRYIRSNGETVPDKAGERTSHYLKFMADIVNDGILTGDAESIRHQIEAHVIKYENVPESYFDLHRRIAREQGHGDIEFSPNKKYELIGLVQADQRQSLSKWAEYLAGDDANYPDWFKRYAWDSILKLGDFDKEKIKFDKRDDSTVALYPEINRKALADVYDVMKKFHVLDETIDELQLTTILKEGSFSRLYAHAIKEVVLKSLEGLDEARGSWRLFKQTFGDQRVAKQLSDSLQGRYTGWCTVGEQTAYQQIENGDFYVYYTRDEDGNDTIPRVAIRMEDHSKVAEVRGILPDQELEPTLVNIANEQLKGLPGGEKYIRRAADMKRLTTLEKKLQKDPDVSLSAEDFVFLYEFDQNIEGFGYDRDPRIAEIQSKRSERDRLEFITVLPEILLRQRKASYSAYYKVAKFAGVETISQIQFDHLLKARIAEWSTNGVVDYIVRDYLENGNKPNLLATPNVIVDWQTLRAMAAKLGEGQSYRTNTKDELYSQYTAKELSGQLTSGPLRFGLILSGYTKQLSIARADAQLATLRRIQKKQPEINMQIPSVLDALILWHTIRARGDVWVGSLSGKKNDDRTFIKHLDLAAKYVDDKLSIPVSWVNDSGGYPFRHCLDSDSVFTSVMIG